MLAGEVVQAAKAAFGFGESVRVGVQVVLYAVQLRQRFVQLDAGGVEHGVNLAQPRVVLADPAQFVPHLLQQRQQGSAIVVAVEQAGGALAAFDQRGGMGLTAVVGGQRGQRGRLQVFALQLVELMAKEADAVGNVALL